MQMIDSSTKSSFEGNLHSPSSSQFIFSKPDEDNYKIEGSKSTACFDSEHKDCDTSNSMDRIKIQESSISDHGLESNSEQSMCHCCSGSCTDHEACLHSELIDVDCFDSKCLK